MTAAPPGFAEFVTARYPALVRYGARRPSPAEVRRGPERLAAVYRALRGRGR